MCTAYELGKRQGITPDYLNPIVVAELLWTEESRLIRPTIRVSRLAKTDLTFIADHIAKDEPATSFGSIQVRTKMPRSRNQKWWETRDRGSSQSRFFPDRARLSRRLRAMAILGREENLFGRLGSQSCATPITSGRGWREKGSMKNCSPNPSR
jgi:plasmid stabilization system protein ParE